MSRRLAQLVAVGAALLLLPAPVAGHALGQTFQLPIPLWLYLAGAAAAVGASFVVTAVVARAPEETPAYPTRAVPAPLARVGSVVLRIVGIGWWYGTIVAGATLGEVSPLPATLLWIGIWVGLPIVAFLIGNPWPSLSPFRTTYQLLSAGARVLGVRRLDAGLRYPPGLGRWPAAVLLLLTVWFELVLSGTSTPHAVALLMGGYSVLTLAGVLAFGPIAWLRNAELLEVYLGWFGRLGPIARRSVSDALCAGCADACDPAHCLDCPECSVVAEPGELSIELRPWFVRLTDVRHAGWSDAAFIVLALAAVSYDGLKETAAWAGPLRLLFTLFRPALEGGVIVFYAIDTIGLLIVALGFLAAFAAALAVARRLAGPGTRPALGGAAGAYAATLLPIAGGYLLAHYLTLLIMGVVWLPRLLADLSLAQPITLVAPPLDWIPISFVWYLSVGAIVLGHVVAIVLAHRIAMRDAPTTAVQAALPLVALMVGYTVFSLWIIAQPIVIEPGVDQVGA